MGIASIIVNYGTGQLVLDHLDRIRTELQSVPGSHLYIVDNLSPNGDAALLEHGANAFDDVTVIAAPKNGGFSYGNNVGIRQAMKDGGFSHIFLLNPDAYPLPGCVSTLHTFMKENEKVGIVGSQLEGEDKIVQRSAFRFMSVASEFEGAAQTGPISKLLASKIVAPPIVSEPHLVDWVCGASMLIDIGVFDRIGLMDENYFLYYEEVDFQLLSKRAGFETWYVPAARAVHLVGQSTDMKDGKQRAGAVPSYWYESRHYYFLKNYGGMYAMTADVARLFGKLVFALRQFVTGRGDGGLGYDVNGIFAARKRSQA